jgi:hypothetical protein
MDVLVIRRWWAVSHLAATLSRWKPEQLTGCRGRRRGGADGHLCDGRRCRFGLAPDSLGAAISLEGNAWINIH